MYRAQASYPPAPFSSMSRKPAARPAHAVLCLWQKEASAHSWPTYRLLSSCAGGDLPRDGIAESLWLLARQSERVAQAEQLRTTKAIMTTRPSKYRTAAGGSTAMPRRRDHLPEGGAAQLCLAHPVHDLEITVTLHPCLLGRVTAGLIRHPGARGGGVLCIVKHTYQY